MGRMGLADRDRAGEGSRKEGRFFLTSPATCIPSEKEKEIRIVWTDPLSSITSILLSLSTYI